MRAPRNFGERLFQSFLTFSIPLALLNLFFERKEHGVSFLVVSGALEAVVAALVLAVFESLVVSSKH